MGAFVALAMKTIVLKYGGSLLFQEDGSFNITRLKSLASQLKILHKNRYQVILVVGGGTEARKYIRAALQLGANQAFGDLQGIKIAQLNARTILPLFSPSQIIPVVPETIEEAVDLAKLNPKKILVLGGITPGQSTDAVAALMAETLEAELLIRATDLDGVYTANPDDDPNAQLLPVVSMEDLLSLINQALQTPGEYPLLDQVAANILRRSQIRTIFINGKKTDLISKVVLEGKYDVGTLITHSKKQNK